MESKGTEFRPLANRAHNKADKVERKNCVVKDVLERIDADIEQREHDTRIKVSSAEFISKMLNGNSMASSFEMATGYTLAISGVSSIPVSIEVWRAQKELKAQMLLARIMNSRPRSKRLIDSSKLSLGERVLILVPGGSRK